MWSLLIITMAQSVGNQPVTSVIKLSFHCDAFLKQHFRTVDDVGMHGYSFILTTAMMLPKLTVVISVYRERE